MRWTARNIVWIGLTLILAQIAAVQVLEPMHPRFKQMVTYGVLPGFLINLNAEQKMLNSRETALRPQAPAVRRPALSTEARLRKTLPRWHPLNTRHRTVVR